jgi:hypothetical protein
MDTQGTLHHLLIFPYSSRLSSFGMTTTKALKLSDLESLVLPVPKSMGSP